MDRNRSFRFIVKAVIATILIIGWMALGRPVIKKLFHNSVVSAQQAANVFVIRNAKIVTVTGATIERGSVLIRDGKIAEVGARVVAPGNAKVIDATGLSGYPGLIDCGTSLGLPEIDRK